MINAQKGSSSLIVLIFVFIVIALSGMIFYTNNSYSLEIHKQKMELKVFYLAEAGLTYGFFVLNSIQYAECNSLLLGADGIENTEDDGILYDQKMPNNGPNGTTDYGVGTKYFGEGACRIRLLNNKDDHGGSFVDTDQILLLQSTGMFGSFRKTVYYYLQANLVPLSPFSKGPLVVQQKVELDENCFIAAINSSLIKSPLEQIMDGEYLIRGDLYSKGEIKIKDKNIVYGNILSSAEEEKGNISVDKDIEIYGNVFTNDGDIKLKENTSVSGNIATNKGEVHNESEGSIPDDHILEEGAAIISPSPITDYEKMYQELLDSKKGGSLEECSNPILPNSSGVPPANIFDNITYNAANITLGIANTNSTYFFENLHLKNGTHLHLLGNVTLIVKEDFVLDSSYNQITANGNVVFLVEKYHQKHTNTIQINGSFTLNGQKSIELNGNTQIQGDATFVTKENFRTQQNTSLSIDGNTTLTAFKDAIFEGNVTFKNETNINVGDTLEFKAPSTSSPTNGNYLFQGNVIIDALKKLRFNEGTALSLDGNENYLFVKDDIEFKGNTKFAHLDPSKFFAYVWGQNAKVNIELQPNSSPLAMTIFAPQAELRIEGIEDDDLSQKTIIGAFVAKQIRLGKFVRIFYDSNLDHFGPTTTFFLGYSVIAYKN